MWFIIILYVIFFYFLICPKTKVIWLYCVLLSGIGFMFLANIFYAIKMSNLNNDLVIGFFGIRQISEYANYFGINKIRLLSDFGESLILLYFVLFSLTMTTKNRYKLIFMIIPISLYSYLNLPNTLFRLYLLFESSAKYAFSDLLNYNNFRRFIQILIAICFVCPYVTLFKRYLLTTFTLIKRNLILQAILIAYIEIAIFTFAFFNLIHNFFIPSANILYNSTIPEKYDLIPFLLIVTFITTIFTLFMVFKSKIFRSQITIKKKNVFTKNKKLDRKLRMILHTYKNIFFSFKQMSEFVLNSGQDFLPSNKEAIGKINQISNSSLYTITKQLEMLKDFQITPKRINAMDIINIAKEKIIMQNQTEIHTICHTDTLELVADEYYLSEMFYTLLINSVEAVINVENPYIAINIYHEENWFLFEIYDNGVGIEKDIRRKVFKPMVSGKNGANNWGIGLYYASKIVSSHNGYIFLDSDPSRYSKFQIYIPKNLN